jgi:hypothetical protein
VLRAGEVECRTYYRRASGAAPELTCATAPFAPQMALSV